jgi:hypothetical protein
VKNLKEAKSRTMKKGNVWNAKRKIEKCEGRKDVDCEGRKS